MATRHHLPIPLTPLIGREDELANIAANIRGGSMRLVTLTGPGGIGKSRLALELAHQLSQDFAAGGAWVSLASVHDSDHVAAALASSLDVQVPAGRSALSALCDDLANQDKLLVIDNFEQVSDAAPLLAVLLEAGSSLRILVTSRSILNIGGEHRVAVGPLALPDEHAIPAAAPGLEGFPAIRLFVERARAATGDFSLTPENAADVVAICRGLDGLPLAIELAAARLRHLTLPAIAARLDDRLRLLAGGPRDRPQRHQSLYEAIDWSYRLLRTQEQSLFRRLAALPAGCHLDIVPFLALSTGPTASEALEHLSTLVDSSLVICFPDHSGEPRYGMLETIRQFGLMQLQSLGELDDVYQTLCIGYTNLADRARVEINGLSQKPWIERLEAERANFRTICEWAIRANEPDIVLRLSFVLWQDWVQRGNLDEGRDLLGRALASPGPKDEALRANAIYRLGNLAFELHDYIAARSAYSDCLELWSRMDDEEGVACAHNGFGLIDREVGLYEEAAARFRSASEIWEALDDEPGVAIAKLNLGKVALWIGNAQEATAHLSQSLAVHRGLQHIGGAASTLVGLGLAACLDNRLEKAQELFRESLDIFNRIGDRSEEASTLYAMGYRAFIAGDGQEALRHFHDSLALVHALGVRDGIVECVDGIAAIAAKRGNARDAVRLLAATEAYRAGIGAVPPSFERQVIAAAWAEVRPRLAPAEIDEAKRAGATMSLDDMTIAALRLLKPPDAAAPTDVLAKLSAREREVFTLVSAYMTDREIAERLFLSHRTIERHVGSILEKLEVKNRREAAALGSLRRAS